MQNCGAHIETANRVPEIDITKRDKQVLAQMAEMTFVHRKMRSDWPLDLMDLLFRTLIGSKSRCPAQCSNRQVAPNSESAKRTA